jgi:fibro-slime domain-containing protein
MTRRSFFPYSTILVLCLAACASESSDSRRGSGGDTAGTTASEDASTPAPVDGGGDTDTDGATADGDAGMGGCGDGKVQPGEKCDDGNSDAADGCSSVCDAVEDGFVCPVPGKACVSTVECGDSIVAGAETCDDGNLGPNDGCSVTCEIEPGYTCIPGVRCVAAKCGDGIRAGSEQCDDGQDPPVSNDGCSASCRLEKGYKCETAGMACVTIVCGDGIPEGLEQCDDMNNDLGDGCTPECKREPNCSAGACVSACGDGIKLSTDTEQCDDGNTISRDGCSSKCMVEAGYECELISSGDATSLVIPIVIRDFNPNGSANGHVDFQNVNGQDRRILGVAANFMSVPQTPGPLLGNDGKPVYVGGGYLENGMATTPTTHGATAFNQWYRDDATVNRTILQTITLMPDGVGGFVFEDTSFWPINGVGWKDSTDTSDNFHFTSEVRYWFEYTPGQTLTFFGDDDVWVYVNRQLTLDIGGVHGPEEKSVTLDATKAATLGLEEGKIYEIVVFQAERMTTGSQYKLTLSNFTTERSECKTVCGDGKVAGEEQCDDGVNDGTYGSCTATCKRGPSCGDAKVQTKYEACDDGVNLTPYADKDSEACAPGCKRPKYCGDKHVDAVFGEECDSGKNPGGYGKCQPDCTLGPRCGDDILQEKHEEECDDGNLVNGDGCDAACRFEGPQ